MPLTLLKADPFLAAAVAAAQDALRHGSGTLRNALDDLPVPVYVTDEKGIVSYYNPACVPFAGREPRVGEDKWCVTWRLYTPDGQYMPHNMCPMAVAIRERRPVRGLEAIAERPDGTRVSFEPYPTPILDKSGAVIGAVNLFIDVTDRNRAYTLLEQANRCRRLARGIGDAKAVQVLESMATEYEAAARRLIPERPE